MARTFAMQCLPEMDEARADEILTLYAHLSAVTTRMREAARTSDWERLLALEAECANVSSRLIAGEDSAPRSSEYQRRKADLIRKVLEDDAEIRHNVNERLAGLWRLIDGRAKVNKLNAAYGGESGIPPASGL
jgi:flagellar protein FliT